MAKAARTWRSAGIWQHLANHAASASALGVPRWRGGHGPRGFVAGTYKRGIACVHVPTSLLGMVDAPSVARPAWIWAVKNMVGVFHDPLGVYIHMPFLKSLGKRELLNGLAEMIKHGLVWDASHWEAIAASALHDIDALAPLVYRSAAIKAEVVQQDPRESGLRKVLNFGHTIGHGVEAHSWKAPDACPARRGGRHWHGVRGVVELAYGPAAIGRVMTASPSCCCNSTNPTVSIVPKIIAMIELMRNDKKNVSGHYHLLTAIGQGPRWMCLSALPRCKKP
ncbi:MAG: hypothetical protein IPO34_21330 [Dehalococcoidia bacterium]|nr:hypothetical protein [Dehalococcoidia bacterium]